MMQHDNWLRFSRSAMAAAVAVVVAAPALAQNTTSSVGGTITGSDGKPLAGATVTIVHVESGSTNSAVTDAAGRYVARGLRTGGPYTITVRSGSLTERKEGVLLNLAETFVFDAQLGQAAQTITITGRGVSDKFSSSTMGAGTSIGSREIATFASIGRNLQDYARTDPRLAQTDKERGEISAGGQNSRYNSITIDGVTISDTFGLESNNLPTIRQPINIDAIQSVQVNLSNYDVTQRGYTGANINAVTKSGTNELHGSVAYIWRNDGLVGDRFNRVTEEYFPAPSFKESTVGFTLGGPIIQDKLFFFMSHERLKSTRTRPDFAPVGGAGINVGISRSAVDSAVAIASGTWAMDIGSVDVPADVALKFSDTMLKLDWNINDAHRANLRYTHTTQTEPFLVGFSATSLSLGSYWYNQDKTIKSLVGQWFADWTPEFSTEFKLSQRKYDSQPTPTNGTRLPVVGLRFDGALPTDAPAGTNANARFLNFGTERSRQFNILRTDTTDAYLGATWTLGEHELKFGLDYQNNDIYNAFLQDVNGNYTFRCENSSTAVTYSFGAINCATATAAQVQAAVLENFRLGRASAYQVQVPLAGRSLNDAVAEWSLANTGLFLQDTWKPAQGWNVTVGLRVDQQGVPNSPIANAAAGAPTVAGNVSGTGVVTRNSGGFGLDNTVTLDGNTLVQPRVGFNWNLGDKETRRQLRGGLGLFQGAAANVWLSNPFSNTGMAVGTFTCNTFAACAGSRFNANPDTQPTVAGTPPAPNVDFLAPNLAQPSVWKANLGFETELPLLPLVGGLTATVEWLHTKTHSGVFYENLNLGGATRAGPDGRQMFWTPGAYNGGCWTAAGVLTVSTVAGNPCLGNRNRALSNASFNNVMVARQTSEGGGDAITLGLTRPMADGYSWNLAYTRTTAKEVSPLTSSVAFSNWSARNIFNPNEDVAINSNYLIRDRVTGSFSWSTAFFTNHRTTLGVFYEGRRGKPYSWTYLNDLNGDGVGGNDLMYIPTGPGSGEVTFRGRDATETPAQAEAAFWAIVDGSPGLSSNRGRVVGANTSYAPWVNNVDLRLSHEMPGFMKDHKASFSFDILNFGNLLNKKWGRIDEIGFPSNRSFVNYAGLDASGKYIYSLGSTEDYVTRQASGESQWAVQFTLRYSF
jgi:hypothetical protein